MLQKTATTIPLVKIAELRGQQKYGLKTRDDYKRTKQDFIATQNPGTRQNPRPPVTKTTEEMGDSSMKIFYSDYSRNNEDPTNWMQNLNT